MNCPCFLQQQQGLADFSTWLSTLQVGPVLVMLCNVRTTGWVSYLPHFKLPSATGGQPCFQCLLSQLTTSPSAHSSSSSSSAVRSPAHILKSPISPSSSLPPSAFASPEASRWWDAPRVRLPPGASRRGPGGFRGASARLVASTATRSLWPRPDQLRQMECQTCGFRSALSRRSFPNSHTERWVRVPWRPSSMSVLPGALYTKPVHVVPELRRKSVQTVSSSRAGTRPGCSCHTHAPPLSWIFLPHRPVPAEAPGAANGNQTRLVIWPDR